MKHIAICTSEVSYGDAVSNDVMGMFEVLEKQNVKVSIFAENIFKGREFGHPEFGHIKLRQTINRH